MTEILDELSETVYIADTKTYELLFLNKAGQNFFSVNFDYRGRKCYQVLQNRDFPCPFCTNSKLTQRNVYQWEFFNPIVKRHYLLKDKLVQWGGRGLVRMEIALDVTDIKNKQAELEDVYKIEHFVQQCLVMLHRPKNLDDNIQDVLEAMGTFLQAERAYIFGINFEEKYTHNTYEWCAEGIEPEIDNLQHVPLTAIARWIPIFRKNEYIYIEDMESVKSISMEEYEVLACQGIKSLVTVPLVAENGVLLGYIGVDNPSLKIPASSIDILCRTLAYFLVALFAKYDMEKQLKDMSFKDLLTGLQNRNKFIYDIDLLQKTKEGSLGIAYIDMNGLKKLNDTLGHSKGNEALQAIATRLTSLFRKDNVYRVGGDEFVVLCPDIPESIFKNKIEEMKEPQKWGIAQSVAIGAQWFDSVTDVNEQLKATDALMYEDKKAYYEKHPRD